MNIKILKLTNGDSLIGDLVHMTDEEKAGLSANEHFCLLEAVFKVVEKFNEQTQKIHVYYVKWNSYVDGSQVQSLCLTSLRPWNLQFDT